MSNPTLLHAGLGHSTASPDLNTDAVAGWLRVRPASTQRIEPSRRTVSSGITPVRSAASGKAANYNNAAMLKQRTTSERDEGWPLVSCTELLDRAREFICADRRATAELPE